MFAAGDGEGGSRGPVHQNPDEMLEANFPPGSRLTQITDWLGEGDGECLIILDECHKAKNLVDDAGTSK